MCIHHLEKKTLIFWCKGRNKDKRSYRSVLFSFSIFQENVVSIKSPFRSLCRVFHVFFIFSQHTSFQRLSLIQVRLQSSGLNRYFPFMSLSSQPARKSLRDLTMMHLVISASFYVCQTEIVRFLCFHWARLHQRHPCPILNFSFVAKISCDVSHMSVSRKASSITGEFPLSASTDGTAVLSGRKSPTPQSSHKSAQKMISTLQTVHTSAQPNIYEQPLNL